VHIGGREGRTKYNSEVVLITGKSIDGVGGVVGRGGGGCEAEAAFGL
jgi:hypothetical protein